MESHVLTLADTPMAALAAKALWLPEARLLCVADMHLGKAERIARREGRLTPPYETAETLGRLGDLIAAHGPRIVVCLGDSFDDDTAAEDLDEAARQTLAGLMAGRRWVWIAGNHDPAPIGLGGEHRADLRLGDLVFRHVAAPDLDEAGEISGHHHPKVWLRGPGRPAFLADARRVILPAFGAYVGGLDASDPVFDRLMGGEALALMTGRKIVAAPRAGLPPRGGGALQRKRSSRPASLSACR